jgi:hypothetical protein
MRPSLSRSSMESSVSVTSKGSRRIVDNRLDDLPECALPELHSVLFSFARNSCIHKVRGPVSSRKSEAP